MKGFTIIEILVAVFILVVGIVAVLSMFPLGMQMATANQLASVAAQLGQAKIEEAVSSSYNDTVAGSTLEDYDSIVGFESYKRQTDISCVYYADLSEVACDYDLSNDPDPLKKIEVTVFWKSTFGGSESSINLVSLIAKK